ncbi:hypothetical protein C7M56_13145 [Clostridium botulinum]|uniref:MurNAc-LAA domain-containing protein n=1 Tax=Clostridium botulinum TaxID=1491 RepID=A0ABC8CZQ7_CLOBO|nr:hypothetical protein C7M56_13145 [Clostridium botulinum]
MNKKKGCLILNIISLFFMIGLLIFPMSVQAYNNLIINVESPKESELFNGDDLNVRGTVDSKERLKLIEIYLNNEKIGQAKTETSVNKDSSYLTNFEYKKDMSNIKNGEYLLKIVAIDENDNKEEKSLKIYVKNQQEQTIQDNVLKNEENNTLTNNTYKETKALSVPLSGKATIQTYDIMLGNEYITGNKLLPGKTYTIKGYASSPNKVLYEFWVKDSSTGTLTKIREYNEDRYANWTPAKSGEYTIIVNVKDIFSLDIFDSKVEKIFTVLSNSGFKTVIVDAGHGGYDSGAVGPTGVKEKDITLKVALKLGNILENNGVKVIYTRTSDNVSWPSNESQDLAARVAIANSNNTDLYVSIHANSFNGSANGTETYYYSGSAKGKEAAEAVQKELVNAIGLYNRGTKTAGYYVLKNTISPSILVELGFIDNRNEEILLNSDWFQQKCAEAIAKGILGTSFI